MGFILKHRGRWTVRDEATLAAWLRWPDRTVDTAELTRALSAAMADYTARRSWLYVCAGSECHGRRPAPLPVALAEAAARAGCAGSSITQCQGLCHRAPVAQEVDASGRHRMVEIDGR